MERVLHNIKTQLPAIPQKTLFCKRIREWAIAKNRLSIFVAPAGYGKTTAVLISLKNYRASTWWYRLEQEDAFLEIFYLHLIEVLFSGDPQILQDQKHLLRSLQNLEEAYSILNAQICQDLMYLYGQSKEPHFLVLDDFQWVCDLPAFSKILPYIVRNMPECMHLVITSRCDPGILSGKLCMSYACKQYTAEDLLFSPDEVRELIEGIYGFHFSPEQYELVLQRSQGWVAGIYILSYSIQNQIRPEKTGNLLSEADSLFSLFFLEYLVAMSPEHKSRLMDLAMLEDFSIDELNELFHQDKAEEFLRWLAANQLCFHTVSQGQTRYYFHSLLSGELKRLFTSTHTVKEQHSFFLRAAEFYLEHDLVKAIQFLLKAGALQRAFTISAHFARACFSSGATERFDPVLSLFTPEQVMQDPYLLLMEGVRVLNIDRVRAQTAFMQALRGFRKLGDYLFLMNSFGMLMVVAFQHKGFASLQEAARLIPVPGILLKGGSARTLLIVSRFIALVGNDRLKQASLFPAILDRKNIREEMWHFSYLMIRGIYFYRRGDLTRSRENLEMILSHPVMRSDDQWRTIGLVSCCYVSFLQSDLPLMQYFINEFSLLAERLHSDFALGYAEYLRGILRQIQGNTAEALVCMENSRAAYRRYGSHVLQMDTECMSFIISEATSAEMIQRARTIVDSLKRENTGHGLEELASAALGILLRRAGELEEAEIHLRGSASVSEKKGALQNAHALYLQLADLYYQQGKVEAGREYFLKWTELGRKNRYLYSVPFTHESLRRVLACSERTPHAREVAGFYEVARRKGYSEESVDVTLFGPFRLRVGSRILQEKDFKTRKVSGLLKYILVRGEPRTREQLAGIFWPESDSKSAGTSLRVALYELRKVLAGVGIGFDCETALLKEGREGFSRSDSQSILMDTQKMERLYEQWQTTEPENELPLLMQICDLYHGPFLESGEYDDWVTIQREYYSAIYFEVLHALGELAVRTHGLPAASYLMKGLQVDPLDEASYSYLTTLYEQAGQGERAESLRKQFKKRFKKEMGFDASV